MKRIILRNFVTAVMVAGVLSACNLPGRDVPSTDTPSAPGEQTTEPGDQSNSTATAAPTVTALPTATSAAAATAAPTATTTSNTGNNDGSSGSDPAPAADAQRLSFAAGATRLTTDVSLSPQETASYVLRVSAGQLMDVSFGPNTSVQLAVYGADGDVLKSGMSESSTFRGDVPSTQDYYVDVTAGSQAVSTTMTVIIPERIIFGEGDTAATVQSDLAANHTRDYVLTVEKGQLMDVSFETPDTNVQLIIYGADGAVLKSGMSEGAFFRGTVPSTQDYIIDVRAGSQPVSTTMTVLVPERITFATGATSAVVEGQLDAQSTHHYVINVAKDQLMEVSAGPQEDLRLVIYGADGTVLKSGMGGGAFFRGTVPSRQDYIIDVTAGAQPANYTMSVLIPERITFEAGATSAEVSGSLDATSSHTYVINAQAGQTMQVDVTPNDAVQTSIYGVDGSVMKSGMGGGPDFTGDLTISEDYIIVVKSGPDATDYTMTVTIQ